MTYEVEGRYFDDYDKARDYALELITKDDIYDFLCTNIGIEKILDWCFHQEKFFDFFEDEILQAEQDAIDEFYPIIELDEEEKEE